MKTSFAASFTVALAVAISVIIPSTGLADETHYPVTTKNCGRELTFHKAPSRAFAGGQNSAEVFYLLGLGDKVVGTGSCGQAISRR